MAGYAKNFLNQPVDLAVTYPLGEKSHKEKFQSNSNFSRKLQVPA